MWSPRMSMSFTSTKGLQNAPGDNNCFLNSAVQVLWHLDVFRRSFRILSGHACLGNSCIFCALKVIFTQFQFSDQKTLPPDALRKALAHTFVDQQRFQLGLMDDAAECFENILQRIHFHIAGQEDEDMCQARHCISHTKFAMTVVEQVVCQCGATSEPLPFSQMVHYVSTSALVEECRKLRRVHPDANFGRLLRDAGMQGDIRDCPSKCGRKVQIRKNLMNTPDVVSVGLVWDSDHCSPDHIKEVVRSIGTLLSMQELYNSVVDGDWARVTSLRLVGVVCYYGKHYSTFFYHSKIERWISYDDASVKEMGRDWSSVADKCCRGHYQPLLLLYANSWCEPIDTSTAPHSTYQLTDHRFYSPLKPGLPSDIVYSSSSRLTNQKLPEHPVSQSSSNDVQRELICNGKRDSNRYMRSLTPDLELREQEAPVIRRSVTPGPEWGKYHSDDEDTTKPKPDITHLRQSSFLTAMDNVGRSNDRLVNGGHQSDHCVGNRPIMDSSQTVQREVYKPYNSRDPHVPICKKQQSHLALNGYQTVASTEDIRIRTGQQPLLHEPVQAYQKPVPQPQHAYQPPQPQAVPVYPNAVSQPQHAYQPQQAVQTSSKPMSQPQNAYQPPQTQAVPAYPKPLSQPQHAHQPLSQPQHAHQPPQPQAYPKPVSQHTHQPPLPSTHNVDLMNKKQPHAVNRHNYVRQGENPSLAQDLLGPLPKAAHAVPADVTQSDSSRHDWTLSGCSQYRRQLPVTNNKMDPGKTVPDSRPVDNLPTRVSDATSHNVQTAANAQKNTTTESSKSSHLESVAFKRTRSLEDCESAKKDVCTSVSTAETGLAKGRPHSARPYDYAHRPVVAPKPNTSSRTQCTPDQKYLAGEDQITTNSIKTDKVSEQALGDNNYGTYISRKAVESILKYQNGPTRTTSVSSSIASSKEADPSVCVRDFNRVIDSKTCHTSALTSEALKVDIPDNMSIGSGSHKDSGYRSGGSSGDRASSASSVSVDSPIIDPCRGYPPALYRALYPGISQEAGSRSSTDSMASIQSSHSSSTLKTNTLDSITTDKTQTDTPKDADLNKQPPFRDVNPLVNVNTTRGSNSNDMTGSQHFDNAVQRLLMQSEGLMEMSTSKEKGGDLPMALLQCNQALGHLKSALTLCEDGHDTKAFLRVKHNLCVLRSRSLYKHIRKRQETSHSKPSGDATTKKESVCSTSLGTKVGKPYDLIQLEQPQHEIKHQQLKKKLHELYAGALEPPVSSQQSTIQPQCDSVGVNLNSKSGESVSVTPANLNSRSGQCDAIPQIHRSLTDPALSTKQKPAIAQKPKPPVPRRISSITSDTSEGKPCHDDDKQAQLYGTLPKKDKSCGDTTSSPKDKEVYDCFIQRQKAANTTANRQTNCEDSLGDPTCKDEPSHARQLSKEEIRQVLLTDYFDPRGGAPDKSGYTHDDQDVTDGHVAPSESDCVKQRKMAYEEMLCRQVAQLNTRTQSEDIHSRQNTCTNTRDIQSQQAVQLNTHTDTQPEDIQSFEVVQPNTYIPSEERQCFETTQLNTCTQAQSNTNASRTPDISDTSHVTLTKRKLPQVPRKRLNGGQAKAPSPALHHLPNPSDLHPNITDRKAVYSNPNPFNEEETCTDLSWQHVDIARTDPSSLIPMESKQNGLHWAGERKFDRDVMPPPSTAAIPENTNACLGKSKPLSGDLTSDQKRAYPVPPPQLPPPYPGKPGVCRTPSISSNSSADSMPYSYCIQNKTALSQNFIKNPIQLPSGRTSSPCPSVTSSSSSTKTDQIPCLPSPGKSALSKKKKHKSKRQQQRNVTFSDNITLIAVPEDMNDEIDYIAHVSRLISKKPPLLHSVERSGDSNTDSGVSRFGYDSDYDEDSSESLCDSDNEAQQDQVLCCLCRKRRVSCGDTYCQACTFYMSRFTPQPS